MHASLNSRKIANLRSHRVTAPVAGLPQLLGCSATLRCRTLGRPLTSCGSQMFPDDFPRISLDACTLGCSRWNTCPMHLLQVLNILNNIFQYVQRISKAAQPKKPLAELRHTVLASPKLCQLRNSAKLIQVAPFTPSAINALITALGTAWCDLRNLPEVFSGASGG